jgi:hypothetical protein
MCDSMVQWALALDIVGLVIILATAAYAITASSSYQRHSPQRVAGAVSNPSFGRARLPLI